MSVAQSSISTGLAGRLNGRNHRLALNTFLFIVVAHWAEHIIQAIQIWALGWPRAEALGLLGVPFPWLIKSEALHYGYALVMLLGLWILRHGFVGRGRKWWMVSLWIQAWHHLEHLILLSQAVIGVNLLAGAVPVSIVQLIVPRVELHLLYNVLVFIPMVIAVYFHLRPSRKEFAIQVCSCKPQAAGVV